MSTSDLKMRTKQYALKVIRLYVSLPKTTEAQILGKQMLRSGTSVGAHYREAQRAKSNADLISKLEGALPSNNSRRNSKSSFSLYPSSLCMAALSIETLTGIRHRGNGFNRAMRTELNNWAFNQLKQFVSYKAKRVGVTVIEVDPKYSSQTCSNPACGYCDKANRKTQDKFECLKCGLKLNADYNAALNLKARGELSYALMFWLEANASS